MLETAGSITNTPKDILAEGIVRQSEIYRDMRDAAIFNLAASRHFEVEICGEDVFGKGTKIWSRFELDPGNEPRLISLFADETVH